MFSQSLIHPIMKNLRIFFPLTLILALAACSSLPVDTGKSAEKPVITKTTLDAKDTYLKAWQSFIDANTPVAFNLCVSTAEEFRQMFAPDADNQHWNQPVAPNADHQDLKQIVFNPNTDWQNFVRFFAPGNVDDTHLVGIPVYILSQEMQDRLDENADVSTLLTLDTCRIQYYVIHKGEATAYLSLACKGSEFSFDGCSPKLSPFEAPSITSAIDQKEPCFLLKIMPGPTYFCVSRNGEYLACLPNGWWGPLQEEYARLIVNLKQAKQLEESGAIERSRNLFREKLEGVPRPHAVRNLRESMGQTKQP